MSTLRPCNSKTSCKRSLYYYIFEISTSNTL